MQSTLPALPAVAARADDNLDAAAPSVAAVAHLHPVLADRLRGETKSAVGCDCFAAGVSRQ